MPDSSRVFRKAEGRASSARPLGRSIFARQQNRVVAEIKADLVERKIRERDPLRKNGVAVAVLASELRRVSGGVNPALFGGGARAG